MAETPKSLPKGTEQYSSIEIFRQTAQDYLEQVAAAQGRTAAQVEPDSIQIRNPEAGDGRYSLLVYNQDLDTYVSGEVFLERHEMAILSGKPAQETPLNKLRLVEMEDACSLSRELLGPEEIPGPSCQDGVVDPRLMAAKEKYESITKFESYCRSAHQQYLQQNFGGTHGSNFSLKRSRILNPLEGNGMFSLYYDNPVNGFACHGLVDSTRSQVLLLSHGTRKEIPAVVLKQEEGLLKEPGAFHEMTDACRMTEELLGSREFLSQCLEFSPLERSLEKFSQKAWDYGTSAAAALGLYSLVSKGVKWMTPSFHARTLGPLNDAVGRVFQPVTRPLAQFRGWAWQGLRSVPGRSLRALQQTPQLVRDLYGALKTAPLWARLAPMVAGAGGGTVTSGTGSLTGALTAPLAGVATALGSLAGKSVMAAAAGEVAAVAGVGFAAGFGVGVALEKGQQALFGTSISDKAGDWMYEAWGPADAETVEWVDRWLGWM